MVSPSALPAIAPALGLWDPTQFDFSRPLRRCWAPDLSIAGSEIPVSSWVQDEQLYWDTPPALKNSWGFRRLYFISSSPNCSS